MKKKINIYFIIIFIVSIIDILYGVFFQIDKNKYMDSLIPIDANIHQITKNKNVNTLYVDYYVDNKLYNSVISSKNMNIKISDDIKIYCETDNLSKCNDGEILYSGIYVVILGIIILIIDFIFLFTNCNNKLNNK